MGLVDLSAVGLKRNLGLWVNVILRVLEIRVS